MFRLFVGCCTASILAVQLSTISSAAAEPSTSNARQPVMGEEITASNEKVERRQTEHFEGIPKQLRHRGQWHLGLGSSSEDNNLQDPLLEATLDHPNKPFVRMNDAHPPDIVSSSNKTDDQRQCRVIIESKADFHHELIESIVLRYPLPWHKFNCSIDKPIIYDFALVENIMPYIEPGMFIGPRPKNLHETEFWGWKQYFQDILQYRSFDRVDSGANTSKAYFNNLVSYHEYDSGPYGPADAVIDVSCDLLDDFETRLTEQENLYCVLQMDRPGISEYAISKSCWVTPMYRDNYCNFLAVDLPRFDEELLLFEEDDEQLSLVNSAAAAPTPDAVKVCVVGRHHDHKSLAHIFSKIPYKEYNVWINLLTHESPGIKHRYEALGLGKRTTFTSEKDFLKVTRHISQNCDVLLPGKDPLKHLTGLMSQLVAYKIPSVMHQALERIYHDHLTAPVEIYTNTTKSFIRALAGMVERVGMEKRNKMESPPQI